jgi:MraZ protein
MFRGRYDHSVDEKGRTSIPVKFRELLTAHFDDRLIVTNQFDTCLVAYPYAEWAAFEEKVALQSQFDENIIALKRFFIAAAVECPVDRQGRILLPQNLRDYADIRGDAVWVGQVRTIEIWAAHRWKDQQEVAKAPGNVQALRASLGRMGL